MSCFETEGRQRDYIDTYCIKKFLTNFAENLRFRQLDILSCGFLSDTNIFPRAEGERICYTFNACLYYSKNLYEFSH
jgi:hypothetical protein